MADIQLQIGSAPLKTWRKTMDLRIFVRPTGAIIQQRSECLETGEAEWLALPEVNAGDVNEDT